MTSLYYPVVIIKTTLNKSVEGADFYLAIHYWQPSHSEKRQLFKTEFKKIFKKEDIKEMYIIKK